MVQLMDDWINSTQNFSTERVDKYCNHMKFCKLGTDNQINVEKVFLQP